MRDANAPRKDRMEAADWLANRYIGRPSTASEPMAGPELDRLEHVSDTELAKMIEELEAQVTKP